MPRGFRFDWRGGDVADDAWEATRASVDETVRAAAAQAAGQRSGRTGDITARVSGVGSNRIKAEWGLFPKPRGGSAWHELFIEVGTAFHPGDSAKRRAAEEHYPRLPGKIRGRRG